MRLEWLIAAWLGLASASFAQDVSFDDWLDGFHQRALAAGITKDALNRALDGVAYDPAVIRRDRRQSEFTKTIWDYLSTAVSDARIANGRKALARQRDLLARLEAEYGVRKEILLAIWGLESAYGAYRGDTDTISALVTLAHDSRRSAFFEDQLLAALKILQSGDAAGRRLTGSWAGAMGHTQFMPQSFLEHAVDFRGDGRRDIWGDDPTDALASAAAYLRFHGWQRGQPWGVEVQLPEGFDYRLADRDVMKSPAEWAAMGLRDMAGTVVPDHGRASILLPAGAQGAAFMIFDNFAVLERYNTADAYVIGVGHLADRIAGGAAIAGGWPLADRALSYDERIELQERLRAAGFDPQKIDGRIGPLTIAAVRDYQLSRGAVPDGYASPALLQSLR